MTTPRVPIAEQNFVVILTHNDYVDTIKLMFKNDPDVYEIADGGAPEIINELKVKGLLK